MFKKIICIVFTLVCIFSFTSVNATTQSNFLDLQAYDTIYKMSEESDVALPFVKIFADKAIYDMPVTKSGLSVATKEINISQNVQGVQTIISRDTVCIDGNLEYGIIIATNVEIAGTIEKDVFILAKSIFITEDAKIGGDVVAMAPTIDLKGTVEGNFIASSSNFNMQGNVNKDFRVSSENLEFGESKVGQNIYIETNSEIDLSDRYENAVVNKIQTRVLSEAEKRQQNLNNIYKCAIAVALFTVTNMIIKKINPTVFVGMTNKFKENSSYAVISGVLLLITIPIVVMILLLLSAFGLYSITMPLFVAYMALIILVISLAKFITGAVLYEYIRGKLKIDTKLKEIGALIGIYAGLYILCNIPHIGSTMTMAIILVAAGIIMTSITKKNRNKNS